MANEVICGIFTIIGELSTCEEQIRWDDAFNKCNQSGMTLPDFLQTTCKNSWIGLRYDSEFQYFITSE